VSYNIQDLKNDLTGVIHQTQLNQVFNLNGIIDRAARQVLMDVDPQETKRTVEFSVPIFNSVYDYPINEDVKGNKIIDIIQQVNRLPRDVYGQAYNQAFDIAKQNVFTAQDMFTMNFNTGNKSIRINAPFLYPPVSLNQTSNTTTNGTWTVGGTASNLSVNYQNYVQSNGSLQFDLGIGTGYLENSTMEAINLENVALQASLFINTFLQTGADITAIALRWGSSSSDYYSKSVTVNQQGFAFNNGWNTEQFDWRTATVVGSPDSSSITYLRVSFTTTSAQYGCLLSGISSILGSYLAYEYYSKYMFRDAITGEFQETVTDDSNEINLDTETYNLLFNKVAHLASQQLQGIDALSYDGNFFEKEYMTCLSKYKEMYKSEIQKPQTVYYAQPKKSYTGFIGRLWR